MRSSAKAWVCVALVCAALGVGRAARAQGHDDDDEESAEPTQEQGDTSDAPPPTAAEQPATAPDLKPSAAPTWWFGAYLEGVWVPSFMLKLFLSAAPTVGNVGFGITATHRNPEGMSIVLGLGYSGYGFDGPFRIKGDPEDDTEYVSSTLGFLHVRGQLMWSAPIVKDTLTFEYGVGLDLGVVLGQMTRTEAFRDTSGAYQPCVAAHNPFVPSPSGKEYCEAPATLGAATDGYNQHGAQYHVVEKRVPPVALIPMLPALALRYAATRELAIKLDAAFGLLQFVVGISAAYGVDL
jgi:hypothetical protein